MSYIPIAASPEYSTVTLQVGLKERLRSLHISDTHLLFSDGRDCRAKYDVALRRWGEYVYANVGRNVTYFLDALLYAKRNGLLLLHTGDLIDFYSPANLEAAERLLELAGVFPVCGESRIHQLFRPASGEPGGAGGSTQGSSENFCRQTRFCFQNHRRSQLYRH